MIETTITQQDVDAVYERVPGAKDALQGMDAESLQPLWEFAVREVEAELGMLAELDTVVLEPRAEAQRRVANAVRALCYGEDFDDEEVLGID